MKTFRQTHTIVADEQAIKVMLADSVLYTRQEFNACDTADWEIDADGDLRFQSSINYPYRSVRLFKKPSARRNEGFSKCPICGVVLNSGGPVTVSGVYGDYRIQWGSVGGVRTTRRTAIVCHNCGVITPLKANFD